MDPQKVNRIITKIDAESWRPKWLINNEINFKKSVVVWKGYGNMSSHRRSIDVTHSHGRTSDHKINCGRAATRIPVAVINTAGLAARKQGGGRTAEIPINRHIFL